MSTEEGRSLMESNVVNGTAVVGEDGEVIGSVDHLVLDLAAGRVAYAVVAFGGFFMGLGEQNYSIPWGSVRFDADTRVFITAITREQIEAAPQRPADGQVDRKWDERTFEHFGVPPYWL